MPGFSPYFLRALSLLAWCCLALSLTAGAQVIDTYAGGGASVGDGTLLRSLDLRGASTIAVDHGGRVHVALPGRILRLGGGMGRTVVGTGEPGYSGDGGPARAARIGRVTAIAFDPEGRLLFADRDARRIRRVEHDGSVSTIAGNGDAAEGPDSVLAAESGLGTPEGLTVTSAGIVHVATANHYLRRFEPGGNIGTYAGTGVRGYLGDGWMASSAVLDTPMAMAVDDAGSIYFVDRGNNRIRRVDADGKIHSAVGPNAQAQGGISANYNDYRGLAVDAYRRIHFGLRSSHRFFRSSTANTLALLAGNGSAGYGGDGGPAAQSTVNLPAAVAVAPDQTIYLLDQDASVVRRIRAVPPQGLVPSAPPTPRVQRARTEAYVAFDAPRLDGGSPITGYVVETLPAGGVDGQAGGLSTWRTVTGLDPFTAYAFRVRATNAVGSSRPSGWSPSISSAAGTPPFLKISPRATTIIEGHSGRHATPFRVSLPYALPRDVVFDLEIVDGSHATPGVDFETDSLRNITLPAGRTSVDFDVVVRGDRDVEYTERARMQTVNVRGPNVEAGSVFWFDIIDDDGPAPAPLPFEAVGDIVYLPPGVESIELPVAANDRFAPDPGLAMGYLLPGNQPMQGQVDFRQLVNDPNSLNDDRAVYRPNKGAIGRDRFSYMLTNGLENSEAWVTIVFRPFDAIDLSVDARAGHRDMLLPVRWEQSAASFAASPLASPRTLVADEAAAQAGRLSGAWTIPAVAGGPERRWRILLDASPQDGAGPVRLRVGVDGNGNGVADREEQSCTSAVGTGRQRCELEIRQPAGQAVAYWAEADVAGGGPARLRLDAFEVPDQASDASLMVTAPARMVPGRDARFRIGWQDPGLLPGESRAGFVKVFEGSDEVGQFPVRIDVGAATPAPVLLEPGRATVVSLAPGQAFGDAFIDVPAGATRLRVTVASTNDVDLALSPAVGGDPAVSRVPAGPSPLQAAFTARGPGGQHAIELAPPQIQAGRWYVGLMPGAGSSGSARATISVALDGAAPAFRPGSFFNPARSGHGLFLYPAGGQRAGLWYTYLEDGTSTWYYLQGPAPGANGLWSGDLYRSTWLGDRNALAPIGRATVAPTGDGDFLFSYSVDGTAGSERITPLGRGCPSFEGSALDASSQWFDPALAGSGYSVQLWPDYEFYAAFVYDGDGIARFLTAESPRFLGQEGVIPVEQLGGGGCPTCAYPGLPLRETVGGLWRRYSAGRIEWADLDAILVEDTPGQWTTVHQLQLLGGPGTTQGCQP